MREEKKNYKIESSHRLLQVLRGRQVWIEMKAQKKNKSRLGVGRLLGLKTKLREPTVAGSNRKKELRLFWILLDPSSIAGHC